MLMFWIILALYAGAGIACMPMLTRASYELQRTKWSLIHTEQQSMNYAFGCALVKLLVWPIYLLLHWVAWQMFAEDRKKELEEQRQMSILEARRVIEEDKRRKELDWIKTFEEANNKSKELR